MPRQQSAYTKANDWQPPVPEDGVTETACGGDAAEPCSAPSVMNAVGDL